MRKAERRERGSGDAYGDAYDVVTVRLSWGLISIGFFLFTLPTRYFVRHLPWWRPDNLWMAPLLSALAVPALATLGLLCGLFGLRGRSPSTARIGIFLNVVALGVSLLIFAAFVYIRWGR